jgi:chromosome segregation ATPase
MAASKLADLEVKVKGLIERSQELKRRNAQLEDRLREAEAKLARRDSSTRRWEKEREWVRGRLRKALEELDSIKFEGK